MNFNNMLVHKRRICLNINENLYMIKMSGEYGRTISVFVDAPNGLVWVSLKGSWLVCKNNGIRTTGEIKLSSAARDSVCSFSVLMKKKR